ncbi:MAG: hypothetical protein ACRETF_04610 [Nevskiaceae bacterium]
MKQLLQALAIGTAVTLALFGLGYVAVEQGAQTLSYVLYWQAWVLYRLLPCSVSITPGEFLCESMTAARITFYSGIPVGMLIYSAAAHLILSAVGRRAASGPPPTHAPDDLR